MDMLNDEELRMIAGGASTVDFIDENGKILCTVNDDMNLDKHPMFEKAAGIRRQRSNGKHTILSHGVAKVICKLSRHEQLSAQEEEIYNEWAEKGTGMKSE